MTSLGKHYGAILRACAWILSIHLKTTKQTKNSKRKTSGLWKTGVKEVETGEFLGLTD